VEDGIPFCPQCNAPQIRVGGASAEAVSAAELNPAFSPTSSGTAIQWVEALPSAGLAGLVAALLMFIALGAFGLGLIAAGVLSVVFYRRRNPAGNLTPAMGARLGAVSGTLGFGIFAILSAVGTWVFHSGGELRAAMLQAIVEQAATRSSDPGVQKASEYLKTPAGLVLMMGVGMALLLVFFLILCSLGGAIGAAMIRRRDRL
jgi:hypothetical protein